MNSCSNTPIELVLATTDPKLYDAKNKRWLWNDQMYWAVECLPHRQNTVSDLLVPKINPNNYLKLDDSPTVWDYCKSKQCNDTAGSMQIVFTFNPQSTDPKDFLQFVIDTHCCVTDTPRHAIKDKSGNSVYLSIVEISEMLRYPYVEVWIDGSQSSTKTSLTDTQLLSSTMPNKGVSIMLWVGLIILLIVVMVIGMLLFTRPKNVPVTSPQPFIG